MNAASILTFPTFQREELEFLLEVLAQPQHSTKITSPRKPLLAKSEEDRPRLLCSIPKCKNLRAGGDLCRSHGGRRRCKMNGCEKRDQKRGLCAKHGGVDLCMIKGCGNIARVAQRCGKHKSSLNPRLFDYCTFLLQ